MKHEEIKKGENVTRGHCSGQASLSCTKVSGTCENSTNLARCEEATNLKTTRAAAGKNCCGGGTLATAGSVNATCGGDTNLCDKDGEMLR